VIPTSCRDTQRCPSRWCDNAIAERREAARNLTNETTRAVVEADTDMLEELARDVGNLRLANACLKEVIEAIRYNHKRPRDGKP
jgi:hypothetical protein